MGKEFKELSEEYERQISYGPDTPKRYSWHKKVEKEKKEEEEARNMKLEERRKWQDEENPKK